MNSLLTKVQNLTYERDSLLQEKRNVAMTGFQILLITFCIIIACEFNNRWRHKGDDRNVHEHTSKTDPTVNIVQLRIKHEIEKQDLITRLERESERNGIVCDTYVKSTNTLKDMIGTLKKTVLEWGENQKDLDDAKTNLKEVETKLLEYEFILETFKQSVINAGGDYDGSARPQNPREAREQMHDGDKQTNKTSTAPSETSKTEYGSVQEQEDKVPENFSDEEISDASSVDNP